MTNDPIRMYEALDWIQQTHIAAAGMLPPILVDHIAEHGDPAARMALALRDDLTERARLALAVDPNPQVRANLRHA